MGRSTAPGDAAQVKRYQMSGNSPPFWTTTNRSWPSFSWMSLTAVSKLKGPLLPLAEPVRAAPSWVRVSTRLTVLE
jgi:hypothetical protein